MLQWGDAHVHNFLTSQAKELKFCVCYLRGKSAPLTNFQPNWTTTSKFSDFGHFICRTVAGLLILILVPFIMRKMHVLLPSRGRTCSSSQPLALTAGSRLLSLVSHPLGRLARSSQPSYLISFFLLFSLPFLSMNLCYVRRNKLLLSHILSHPPHLNFSPTPSLPTTEYVILASLPFNCISCPLDS